MKNLYQKWKRISEKIGNFQAKIVFSVLYFLLVFPVGVATTIFKDFLQKRSFPNWDKTESIEETIKQMKSQ